jgi:hypothetical protein
MFEYFAAEYGWTHTYILDNLTPSQFRLYSELLLCRLDDIKIEQQELSIIQGGGDLKEFRRKRKSLREIIKNKKAIKDGAPLVEGPTTDSVRQWMAGMGIQSGDRAGFK